MTHHTISARDANQQFSRLLRQVEEEGEEVPITRRGTPVARLVPAEGEADRRAQAVAELRRVLRGGYRMGGATFNRDEAYER